MAPLDLAVIEDEEEAPPSEPRYCDEPAASWEMMFPVPACLSPAELKAPNEQDLPPAPRRAPEVRPPSRDEAPPIARRGTNARAFILFALLAGATGIPLGWGLVSMPGACHSADQAMGTLAAEALAERIVQAESNGRADAKNERSSATGAGQFLNDTWLELVSAHRPDLESAPKEKILELRHDTDLSRDMVARLAERNARILASRCLPVTPGTLYLAHFAGGGGAASVLLAPDHADAATAMAEGDSRGKLTREMIVAANPFLKSFTVAKLKSWADRKMQSAALLVARRS
jgi:hypothetical protein